MKSKLVDFKKNVHSQYGEDGIIKKIFEIIGTKSKTAIEYGARVWGGLCCSNLDRMYQSGWHAPG